MGNKGNRYSAFLVKGRCFVLAVNRKNGEYLRARLLFCLFFFSFGLGSYAQSPAMRNKAVENKDSIMPFKSRWAFKTNAVDWLMLLPNLTAEFDLFGSPYKHYTLSLGVKGNWSTTQNYKPAIVYNLLDVRAEFRKYFRTTQQSYIRPDTVKIGLFKRLKEDVFTTKRLHPRYWRTYYMGGYVDAANYTLKFGKRGVQGSAYGVGVSGGFSIPLYGYRQNFVDLEIGASVGLVYAKYDVFEHDAESNCYPRIPEKSKGGHIVPYPVVNDLRVAFVYRFSTSVKDKYKLIDHDKINARFEARQRRLRTRDSVNVVRDKEKELKLIRKDSVGRVKVQEKKLKIQQKDSLELAQKQEKHLKDSLKQIQKEEKAQAKELKESAKKEDKDEIVIPQEENGTPEGAGEDKAKEPVAKEPEQQPAKQVEEEQTVNKGGE